MGSRTNGHAIVSGFIGRGRGQRFVTANYDSCTYPFFAVNEEITDQLPAFLVYDLQPGAPSLFFILSQNILYSNSNVPFSFLCATFRFDNFIQIPIRSNWKEHVF